MKVAIDTGPLTSGHSVRGIGVHTRELIKALEKIKVFDFNIEAVDFTQTDLSKYDIAHFTSFRPFFWSVPLSRICRKMVLTIHDTIPLIYPAAYSPGIKGKIRFEIQKLLLRNFDAFITISETSKKDIVRFLPIKSDKIYVTHLAPKQCFAKKPSQKYLADVRNKFNLPENFILYVNDINYNKNIMVLADACKQIDMPLVIVGKQAASKDIDWDNVENQSFKIFTDKYGKNKDVIRIGFATDDDLVAIYKMADVFCMPSLYEGFGLQVLESMLAGCPVVASKVQAHVEIAGDAAVFADPASSQDFADKLTKVMSDDRLRNKLIKDGYEKVTEYSWEKTACETIQVYNQLLK
jgi:glycosyltransferase involved in cell wall biosynthesis